MIHQREQKSLSGFFDSPAGGLQAGVKKKDEIRRAESRPFYRGLLSGEDREIYDVMEKSLSGHGEQLHLPRNIEGEKALSLSRFVTLDRPELYWTKGDFEVICRSENGLLIRWADLLSPEKTAEADSRIFRMLEEMSFLRETDPVRRAENLQNWMLTRVGYGISGDRAGFDGGQTVYSALIRGKSLCMGIAKTVQLLLSLSGTECITVMGSLRGAGAAGHAWNMIRTEGIWRHIDLTMAYPEMRAIRHRAQPDGTMGFLFRTGEEMTGTHILSSRIPYPDEIRSGMS